MTSFVHIHYPEQHPGVARMESAISAARQMRRRFDGTRGLSAVLLAAVVSGLLVAADQVVDSWTGGRLLAAWVVLWAVAFVAMALFAGTARRTAHSLVRVLDAWSYRVAQARADERLWATAKVDARVMADLQSAIARSDAQAPAFAAPAAASTARHSLRQVVESWYATAREARADAQLWNVAQRDARVMSDLKAAQSRAESVAPVPPVTQTLLRAEKASELRDALYARRRRLAYYM